MSHFKLHHLPPASRLLRKALQIIAMPLSRCTALFATMMVMMLYIPVDYYFCVLHPEPDIAFARAQSMAAEAFVAAWLMCGVYLLLRSWRRAAAIVWSTICFILLGANFLIDFVCLAVYQCPFSADIAAVIMATNPSESANFLATYFSPQLVFYYMAIAAGCADIVLGVWMLKDLLAKRIGRRTTTSLRCAVLVMLTASLLSMCLSPLTHTVRTNFRHKIATFCTLNLGHEVVAQNPNLLPPAPDAPEKIVVIIGESLSASHCSLYGYDKNTQPQLTALRDSGFLHVFTRVESPAWTTMLAIQHIIGTWNGEESRPWYECPTLIEIARLSGYHVEWLSNQSAKGIYDSPMTRIADFCDSRFFTNDGMQGVNSAHFDSELLEPARLSAAKVGKRLSIFHLMGSHIAYFHRYPDEFSHFFLNDYAEHPEHQRKTRATYDNSVFYNDFVVSRLMQSYDDTDAIVFYFSDHGQDIYHTDAGYAGHARDSEASRRECQTVPLMVYLTPKARELHPELAERIAASTANPVNLSFLTHTLMDIIGTDFADAPAVATHSFLKNSDK